MFYSFPHTRPTFLLFLLFLWRFSSCSGHGLSVAGISRNGILGSEDLGLGHATRKLDGQDISLCPTLLSKRVRHS
jgi:hypothetical protein